MSDRRGLVPPATASGVAFRSVENRLATTVSRLRARLNRRLGRPGEDDLVSHVDIEIHGVLRRVARTGPAASIRARLGRDPPAPVPGSTNGKVRPHDRDGRAIVFPDGWAVHAWHGTPVPARMIESPTPERIAAERNVEVRWCALERLSWTAYAERANLTHVAESADPGNPGHVLRLCDGPFGQVLSAVNGSSEPDGTHRLHGLRIPPWLDDPVDAAAWTYGLTGERYAQLLRPT
ncbi:hypothetical protein LWP59_27830 [Amycolatopsis acidiphila]|uniref:DUF6745 domain-containing protein n=1 Tax=Amycolatopsis acidiphila TaxID=715473 RepID=A0A557ZWR3_9PSEU|nr:hypothetical protein [Amycolatopsis acidiphila]TVT16445.1 hypothetical protein FNH06_34605 [Amycolatopsis acidiphila]UIJ57924.1 hypothetical protein LWP59_27830 [Amycolatopsis acidiphila]GHG71083.1 hypothetical protein GCM10017788_32760 [Amycolatopsis acidiphila]